MKSLSLLLIPIIISGCDSGVLWQDEPYEVHWINTSSNRTLAYSLGDGGSIGRVEAEVVAVGSNDSYIVAKQRDSKSNEVFYYYVEKKKDNKYFNLSEITKGPFSFKEFEEIGATVQFPELTKEFE